MSKVVYHDCLCHDATRGRKKGVAARGRVITRQWRYRGDPARAGGDAPGSASRKAKRVKKMIREV